MESLGESHWLFVGLVLGKVLWVSELSILSELLWHGLLLHGWGLLGESGWWHLVVDWLSNLGADSGGEDGNDGGSEHFVILFCLCY